jgi:branched-chain amino acid transport system substrate-binding protein
MRFLGRIKTALAPRVRYVVAAGLLSGAVLALAACGSSSKSSSSSAGGGGSSTSSGGSTIDIYSSLPLQGAVNAQTLPLVNGIKLALSQAGGKAGTFTVNYTSLDDSTATSAATSCDVNQSAANARKVATDSKAVFYIGEFNSGCSKVTIPILNVASIPQVSPANTYVGLTTHDPGSAPGEPQKYYPSGKRTYLRLVPRDSIQSVAGLIAMKAAGCTRIAVTNDKTAYGAGLAVQVGLNAAKYGLKVTSNTALDPTSPNFRSFASTVKGQGADCVYTGFNPTGEVELIKDITAAVPNAKVYGGDGVCSAAIMNPAKGGIPAKLASQFHCTVATLDLTAYPGGKTFLAAYKAKYGGPAPDPYAIYGYEAMKLALDTIKQLGAKGNDKGAVLTALFAIKARQSVLGTYGFDANGDTTLKKYGLYKVGPDGNPAFDKTVG